MKQRSSREHSGPNHGEVPRRVSADANHARNNSNNNTNDINDTNDTNDTNNKIIGEKKEYYK